MRQALAARCLSSGRTFGLGMIGSVWVTTRDTFECASRRLAADMKRCWEVFVFLEVLRMGQRLGVSSGECENE